MWREHEQWVKDAVAYIERHMREDVDVADIAEYCSVSRFHFHRVFRRHIGLNAAVYLRERRLAEAAVELLSTNKRILDIALEYRFSGQDSFTRSFKQLYGMTPNEYRKGFRCFRRAKEENRMKDFEENKEAQLIKRQAAPKGWMISGVYTHQYQVNIDPIHVHRGKASGMVRGADDADPQGFCTLMQMFKPGKYAGQRLRLSGFLKTENVKDCSGLWMRVDGKDEVPLNFDNMSDRPVSGTTAWGQYEVVLDIPPYAEAVAFGVLLSGPGKVWLDGIRFDIVDQSVPTTGSVVDNSQLPDEPVNLDFEMGFEGNGVSGQ
ncbi:helix-turn-helix transcriptional regulator [Paenibacillus azoreducens]|uniref:AraC family transcriptional regulator n=1 Tax=Paenibacillus azoreducens TaxID=116718 RepID=A0A920CU77_9BACL|nr:AraC family transcriptional regulator [Paenibacillus azoreducens]GIO51055.1 AraC family transcriptional regulator [Paenibacillus azoreducens]